MAFSDTLEFMVVSPYHCDSSGLVSRYLTLQGALVIPAICAGVRGVVVRSAFRLKVRCGLTKL